MSISGERPEGKVENRAGEGKLVQALAKAQSQACHLSNHDLTPRTTNRMSRFRCQAINVDAFSAS